MILRLWLLVVLTLAGAFAPSRAGARTAETRTWDFFAATANARPESAPQVADSRLGFEGHGYELAPGYSHAAENIPARGIQLNKAIGDATADAIAARYPFALREVPLNTIYGPRRVDVLTLGERNLAIESKVGRTLLSNKDVRRELARDFWLKRSGKVDDVIWEFTPSPITGKSGPDAALQQMLDKLGFGIRQ